MKVLLCMFLNLTAIISVLSKKDGTRGFIRNVQVAAGSSIAFPGYSSPPAETEIPLELLLQMGDVADTREFIENFVYVDDENVTLSNISPFFGHEVIERSASTVKLKMAACQPELKTIPILPYEKSNIFYHPFCVRVERCAGCCVHNLLTCTAVESEILNVVVFMGEYTGGPKMKHKGYKLVPVEKHLKCKCLCKTQPEDCTKLQRYNENTCSCDCNNPDAERKCHADKRNRIWNKDTCSCLCKEELECSTGFYYDPISCRCEVQEGRSRSSQKPWIA